MALPQQDPRASHFVVAFRVRHDALKAHGQAEEPREIPLPAATERHIVAERPIMQIDGRHRGDRHVDVAVRSGEALGAASEKPELAHAPVRLGPGSECFDLVGGNLQGGSILMRDDLDGNPPRVAPSSVSGSDREGIPDRRFPATVSRRPARLTGPIPEDRYHGVGETVV